MKADIILKKKEDAVSPVIGVMLMLVVTIVIAAVVAAFAGGLGSDVEMAPTAALDIEAYSSTGNVKIASLSGESLIRSDITVKVTDASGNELGNGELGGSGAFNPGSVATVTLKKDGNSVTTLPKGNFVTVTVLANGKHIVAKKDVLVK